MPAGLVNYLALTPEERKADYRARVEKAYRESPDDPTALYQGGPFTKDTVKR